MSGINEILVIVLLILGLLILPRVLPSKRQSTTPAPARIAGVRISGKFRLALLLSVLWLFVISVIYVPWQGRWVEFLYAGVGPVIFAWGLFWVLNGFGNYRKR